MPGRVVMDGAARVSDSYDTVVSVTPASGGHMVHRQRVEAPMRIAAALALAVALATGAFATVMPGGGLARSDCYVVLHVDGTRAPTTSRLLTCEDGDPTCDLHGQCNDQCLFGLSICINQSGQAGCTPPGALTSVRAHFKPARIQLHPPTALQGDVCSPTLLSGVSVKVRSNGKKAPGQLRASILARAVAGTRPRLDGDIDIIKCLPRVGPCPTTTSTTTIPSTSTTTPTSTASTIPTASTSSTIPTTTTTAPITSTTSTIPTTTTTTTTTTSTTTSSTSTTTTSSTTTTTTSTTTTTLCPPGTYNFNFSVTSSNGGVFTPAKWPGGIDMQGVARCTVTVQRPSGGITVVGSAGDQGTIINAAGRAISALDGACNGNSTNCKGVDPPISCPTNGMIIPIRRCTDNRPSCSLGYTGTAAAVAHVQCVR